MRALRNQEEIMSTWKGDPDKPLVSICCMTYNHEPYIEDALEGFLIQETNFPFEILIHDDASTDRTADIIREYEAKYPKLIKPIFQTENQYSHGIKINPTYNFPRAQGKYIALCEGDDYWTDKQKSKKQVNFLESNKNFVGCCTNYRVVDLNKKILIKKAWGENKNSRVIDHLTVIKNYTPKVLTSIFLKDTIPKNFPKEIIKAPNADNFLFALITKKGDIAFQNIITGSYREHDQGIWSKKNTIERYEMQLATFNQMAKYFCDRTEKIALKERIFRIEKRIFRESIKQLRIFYILYYLIKILLHKTQIILFKSL